MRYYQLDEGGTPRLAVQTNGTAYDLTTAKSELRTLDDLLRTSSITDQPIDTLADRLLEGADECSLPTETASPPPVHAEEVWAAGVTYAIS
ncbi:fumarylacetoacetate hydrolase, partial [Halobacteria archaeon AArc-xg1-1]|nr:fumarylacetoacetate hydrolase [Halobacteria archaeon AArc-xg1-1]